MDRLIQACNEKEDHSWKEEEKVEERINPSLPFNGPSIVEDIGANMSFLIKGEGGSKHKETPVEHVSHIIGPDRWSLEHIP